MKSKNPEIEAINKETNLRIERADYIEKLCRKICLDNYDLNPDILVCQLVPANINNLNKFPFAWIVPDEKHFIPTWWLFRYDVELILNEINKCPQT